MKDWYGDNDRTAAAWLRELVKDGLIPEGEVDERSIADLRPEDLAGFRRVHHFAGIGGWAYAFELAGWPRERPVWSGSCPCQPFSAAGKRKGTADERHLWPVFFRLIRECRPATIFGEQVASDDGYRWLARVRDDLETAGYAVGCADLPACSAGAPHRRHRLFWVANTDGRQSGDGKLQPGREHGQQPKNGRAPRGLGDSRHVSTRRGQGRGRKLEAPERGKPGQHVATNGAHGRLGDTASGRRRIIRDEAQPGSGGHAEFSGWSGFNLIPCRDGKTRRVEPGSFPLAYGIPGRVGLLRGYGNAIVPQVAAKFIRAFLEAEAETEVA